MNTLILNVIYGSVLIYSTETAPQQPEINDQYVTTEPNNITTEPNNASTEPNNVTTEPKRVTTTEIIEHKVNTSIRRNAIKMNLSTKFYHVLSAPILKLISAPKVSSVLRNIGTCIVNGAMEIVSYYFPAPLIPLIASAAGMVIPFEPVVLLREKMPVTSYRRAFKTAMNSFLSTFDKYKFDDDPYMTRRFNRRFNYDSGEKIKKIN